MSEDAKFLLALFVNSFSSSSDISEELQEIFDKVHTELNGDQSLIRKQYEFWLRDGYPSFILEKRDDPFADV
jgi:hypothetical protein